ncbi:GTPase HflX [Syntrophomonas zehnderi OL-4]|uniref:GTPase HflX n=1 Tax=Syntrophomonas zehnderi OL-4 TaxID=690567 RepID=A0A0E3W2X3_9FIRM|nr:GTPase HflX [Syntrophomonas zehnderi]CFX28590.1 GTPase HflX [Syntrophomonas zehnderi OL-4]
MNDNKPEKAILVGVELKSDAGFNFQASLQELQALTEAAGGEVAAVLVQSRERVHGATYIGKGKLEELKHLAAELEPDLIIFDNELSPVQLRNLEEALNIKIIDRTMLILDIFSQRAKSNEGILQVELARLQYQLPRLTGQGVTLSRLGAGIGTRGSGEQKLELDRRYIRQRIQDIKKRMQKVENTRKLHRVQRQRSGMKQVSLVGYTNAGKSSLFNTLCQTGHRSKTAQVKADQQLFRTLDTTIRKIRWADQKEILLTDTVGFIQNLPHHLVAAFKSTLEEVIEADLLLHVVDISDPDAADKIEVVEKVLWELGADSDRIVTVFNKSDLLQDPPDNSGPAIYVSARTGQGIDDLLKRLEIILF